MLKRTKSGYDIEGSAWYALFAPAGTPQEIVEPLGLELTGLGPSELGAILKADDAKWGSVIEASGFKAD